MFSGIATVTKRAIDFQKIPMHDYVRFMRESGVPEDHVALIKYLFTEVLDGRNEPLTDGVQKSAWV